MEGHAPAWPLPSCRPKPSFFKQPLPFYHPRPTPSTNNINFRYKPTFPSLEGSGVGFPNPFCRRPLPAACRFTRLWRANPATFHVAARPVPILLSGLASFSGLLALTGHDTVLATKGAADE